MSVLFCVACARSNCSCGAATYLVEDDLVRLRLFAGGAKGLPLSRRVDDAKQRVRDWNRGLASGRRRGGPSRAARLNRLRPIRRRLLLRLRLLRRLVGRRWLVAAAGTCRRLAGRRIQFSGFAATGADETSSRGRLLGGENWRAARRKSDSNSVGSFCASPSCLLPLLCFDSLKDFVALKPCLFRVNTSCGPSIPRGTIITHAKSLLAARAAGADSKAAEISLSTKTRGERPFEAHLLPLFPLEYS